MAKRGNIFVDLEKENPLKTILKNGKIPVVRVAEKGFNNYSQKKYFERYTKDCLKYADCDKSNEEIYNGEKPEKGCFVSIGGMQGTWVSDGHSCETINIGYIEPNTKVFITYVHKNSNLKPFSFVTAKERYEDTLECFEKFMSDNSSNQLDYYIYELSNFDIFSEAIVDSTQIKKCVEVSEYGNQIVDLFQYAKDGFLKIFSFNSLIKRIYEMGVISTELKELLGFDEADDFRWDLYHDYELMLLSDEKLYNMSIDVVNKYYQNNEKDESVLAYIIENNLV